MFIEWPSILKRKNKAPDIPAVIISTKNNLLVEKEAMEGNDLLYELEKKYLYPYLLQSDKNIPGKFILIFGINFS